MRHFCKKLLKFMFDKEMWVSTVIGGTGWTLFWVVGGLYCFFYQNKSLVV